MTLQEKIIELFPSRFERFRGSPLTEWDEGYIDALQDLKEELPKILKLIREEVEKLEGFVCIDSYSQPEDTRLLEEKEVLELLK